MAAKLIIHVGPHKTGTTAIQKTLLQNRCVLRNNGIYYPEIGFDYYGHHKLASSVENFNRTAIDEFCKELNGIDGTIVVSSENFSRCTTEAVAFFASRLNIESISIIYYIRDAIQQMYSWWQESIKHGSDTDILEYVSTSLSQPFSSHILNPSLYIDSWSSAFGKDSMTGYLYRSIPDVSEHFMNTVLAFPAYEKPANVRTINKSFDVAATEVMRQLNVQALELRNNGKMAPFGIGKMAEPAVKEFIDTLRVKSEPYVRSLSLSYDHFTLAALERRIKRSCRKTLRDWTSSEHLFLPRTGVIRFLDQRLWVSEPTLSNTLRSIAMDNT